MAKCCFKLNEKLFNFVEPTPETTYNFDIEMDWSIVLDSIGNPYPVTDEATLEQWLTNGMDGQAAIQNDFSNIVITDFLMIGNRIQCNLVADGYTFTLIECQVTNINKIGNVNGLGQLSLGFNANINIGNSLILPNSLSVLELNNNQMNAASYTLIEDWANAQPIFASTCNVYFSGNIDSASGTNLETILTGKNCTVMT